MARISLLAIVSSITTLLLPTTLARPFERPGWGVEEHHGPRPWWSHTTQTHHTYTLTNSPASITPSISSAPANTTCLTTWPLIPSASRCLPVNPHCPQPFPTSWFCFGGVGTAGSGTGFATGTGISLSRLPVSSEALPASSQVDAGTTTDVVPTPTGTGASISNATSLNTFPFPSATGIPRTGVTPTGIIPTGTGTATAFFPPTPSLHAREAQALAMQKRKAFEGPRRRDFPHFWPAHDLGLPFASTAIARTLSHPTGSGTGTAGLPGTATTSTSFTTGTATAPVIGPLPGWPWTFPTGGASGVWSVGGSETGVLTLPIESGIGGPVPTSSL